MRILITLFFLAFINYAQGQDGCSDIIVEDAMIAHFPLDNNATEALGSGFDGIIEGVVPAEDYEGNPTSAYYFDGVDDYIHVGDHFDLNDSDFTVSCWVNVSRFKGLIPGTNSRGGYIVNKGATIYGSPRRAGYSLDAREQNGENYFYFLVGDANDNLYDVNAFGFEENIWYNLMGIKNNDSISLYVDNNLVATKAVPPNINVDTNIPLVFGSIDKLGKDAKGTTYFEGIIDDVRIYKRALSQDERTCLIDGCIPPKLNLGEDRVICNTSSTILDATGPDAKYKWQDGSSNPTFEVTTSGTYWVEVQNSCGVERDTIKIKFPKITNLKMPNVFTPNQDGFNDYFMIDARLLGATLKIYQRSGKKVYESTDYRNDWDGDKLPSAVYFWVIANECGPDYKGWVRIIY